MTDHKTDRESTCKRIAELQQLIKTESARLEKIKGSYERYIDEGTDPDIIRERQINGSCYVIKQNMALDFVEEIGDKAQEVAGYWHELHELRELIAGEISGVKSESSRNVLKHRYIYGLTGRETAERLFYSDTSVVIHTCTRFMRHEI